MSNTAVIGTKSKRTRTKTKRYSPTHDDNGYLHPKGNIGDAHYYRGGMGTLNYFGKIVRKDMNDDNDNDNNDGSDLPTYDSDYEDDYISSSDSEYIPNSDDEDEYINSSDSEHEANSDYEDDYISSSDSEYIPNSDDEDEYISSSDSDHEANSDYEDDYISSSENENEMGIYKSSIEYLTQLASNIVKEMDYDMWEDWTK